MVNVFVSDAIGEERLTIGPSRLDAEQHALWGWKALSALYQASLAACGNRIVPIVRPEIYQTAIAREILGVEAGDWHLAVKPIEHLRPFRGLPNVFACDWPFPELSAMPFGDSPFLDQVRLLRMADAVLCSTDYTATTLRRAGVERVLTLPPFVAPSPPRELAAPSHRGECRRFLSVVQIDHLARQLGPTLEGFAEAARQHGGLRLLVCLQGADAQALEGLRQRVAQIAPAPGPDETISVIGADADDAMERRSTADFFLCADAAAGLCLPLVEAMLAGITLVTTMNAGTASFLPAEAAVPIVTQPTPLGADDEPIARFMPLTSHAPTAAAVRDAVLAAAALDDAARFRMASLAREIAEHRFGIAAFRAGLSQLGALIGGQAP